jgi:hypothetical protein
MTEVARAREICLRSTKPLAPPFHRHIAKEKLKGKICRVGDRIVIYVIVKTDPEGDVEITEETIFRFE